MKAPKYTKDQIVYEGKTQKGILQIIHTEDNLFFWHLVGKNNEILCLCETFKRLQGCLRNLQLSQYIFDATFEVAYIAEKLKIKL